MLLIKEFKEINKDNAPIAGGKGASLGEMTQAGIPVPPGFVILADTFERFLEETDLNIEIESILKKVDIKQTHTVENASKQIQALILSKKTPQDIKKEILKFYKKLDSKFVAVRSSATSEDSASAAWAGQLDSFLNTTEKTLLDNVKKCWASLFTPRAIFYRFEKSLDKTKISVAVVVQKMVQSEVSGIAFSVHPVTQDENQIIIEAGFGLGEAIVSGSITPDSYVVHKKEMDILDINVNEQTKALYKKTNGGNEWKNLGEKGKTQVLSEKEIIELADLIVKIENHYDFPCDIEWAREKGKFYIVQSRPITTLQKQNDNVKEDFFKKIENINWDVQKFNAYPFFLSSVATLSGFKLPWGLSYKHFLCISHNKNVEWHYDKNDWQEIGEVFWNKVKTLDNLMKIINNYRSVYKKALDNAKYDENKLKSYSVDNLKSLLFKQIDVLSASAGSAHIIECASYVAEQKLLKKYFINPVDVVASESSFLNKAAVYAHKLCISKKSEKEIIKLFKDKYSWIQSSYLGRNEISISQIRELAHKKEDKIKNNKFKNKKKLELKFVEILSHLFSWQDERKAHILQNIYRSQNVLDTLADKLNISRECIKFLLPEEIEQITDKKFQKELKERSKIFVDYASSDSKRIIFTGNKAYDFIKNFQNKNQNEKDFLKGQVAFGGNIRGVVRVCLSLESIKKFEEGEILVASMTRPEYSSAMKKALAFVTDEGGITCHAAIIAREMKKPCIIGTKNASQILKDGDLVEVDANNGVVRILDKTNQQPIIKPDNDLWKKSWSLKYNLLLSSYSAEQYTKELFRYVGVDIPRTIIVCKDGISTGYVTSKEADVFALYLAKKITKDEKVVKIWANNLIKNGKKLTKTIKKIEKQIPFLKEIKKKDYNEFIKGFFDYANAHFVAKRTLDCLPKEKQEKFVSIMQDARQKTENVYALVEEFVYKYISILAIKNNYSVDALLYLTNREINSYFDNGDLPSEKILLERKSASALVVDKGNYKIIVGEKDIEELEKNIVVSNNDGVLRGSPAFPGIVTGKVKVIKNSKDYKNFNSGDVLVTVMTRPEHIEFFHKASAIVTDAGGVLSHAAISAREFKKPCVIGTNNATQVLKDGDLVEVDANNGVVKILDKTNKETNLVDEYITKNQNKELYPPIPNMYVFTEASGYNKQKLIKKYFKTEKTMDVLILSKEKESICYTQGDLLKDASIEFFHDYWKNSKILEKRYLDFKNGLKKVSQLYDKFDYKFIDKSSIEFLIKEIPKIIEFCWEVHAGVFFVFEFDEKICLEQIKKLNIKITSEKLKEIINNVSGNAISFDKKQILEYYKYKNSKNIDEKCQYFSVGTSNVDNLQQIKSRLKKHFAGYTKKDIKEIEKENQIKKHNLQKYFRSLTVQELKLAKYFEKLIEIRDERKFLIGKSMTIFFRACQKMFKEVRIAESNIINFTIEDFKKGLVYLKENKNIIIDRKKGFVCLSEDNGEQRTESVNFEETKKKLDDFYKEKNKNNQIKEKDISEIPLIYQEFLDSVNKSGLAVFSLRSSMLVIGAWQNMTTKYHVKFSNKKNNFIILSNKDMLTIQLDYELYREFAKDMIKKIINKKITLNQLKKSYFKHDKKIDKIYKQKINNPAKRIANLVDLFLKFYADTVYIEALDKGMVEEVLKRTISEKEWNEIINFDFEHFEKRWLRKIKESSNSKEVDYIFQDYYFLPSPKNIEKMWNEKKKEGEKIIKVVEDKKVFKEDWKNFVRFVIKLRDLRKDPIAKIQSILCKSARLLYPNISDDVLVHLNPMEVYNKEIPTVEILKKRSLKPYVYLGRDDNSYKYEYSIKEYNNIKNIISSKEKDTKEIKGNSANKGMFTGKARIVFNPKLSLKNFKKGDVLVTGMTRPEFVPLMKKAGAIITDEGGITCHAAIISRELNIPCIIGTKNATQILKNGDLIEVDAENGVVKILEKK